VIESAPAREAAVRPLRIKSRALRQFLRRPTAVMALFFILVLVTVAVFAPLLAPYDPTQTDWLAVRQPPSNEHLMGTDENGRDVLSRVIYGARASLMVGVIAVTIALLIGVPLGLISGYYGGRIDEIIMRVVDAALAFPFLILAIALAATLGPSLTNAMIAIGIASAPIFARLTRGQVLSVRSREYVESARAIGAGDVRIIARYVLPNSIAPILVQSTLAIAEAIIAESALSFLGLGVQPPMPSWGGMLNTAKNFLSQAPWMAIWPGLGIFVTVLAFNLFGDGLRDALDPRE
jgi:peptide/nickel transport system permease protein